MSRKTLPLVRYAKVCARANAVAVVHTDDPRTSMMKITQPNALHVLTDCLVTAEEPHTPLGSWKQNLEHVSNEQVLFEAPVAAPRIVPRAYNLSRFPLRCRETDERGRKDRNVDWTTKRGSFD